ncbi:MULTISPECIES: surface presentation of antigen type M protein [Cedecea]|uniref:Surface presentation of antigen type M protein n=1 Tax=Cedecea davisae DSM 4568 TaxID=566551 RepID=S3JP29_9ENTR|nr:MULTISPECIES: surface presentation of antigen type M protein [Cedecea]EPF14999.1 surface presentation of antigen type M protein [Cedecea davisae DSM 4568]QIX96589.1 hypothetical protein FOC35_13250 [Cedecea sp. FDAARGOS_727]SUX38006.1 type III secretion system protein SpaM [Cedecea davisae]
MRHKIKALIVRSEFNIQRNDLLIAKNESVHRSLSAQINKAYEEMSAIVALMKNLYPNGILNKEKLLAIQRRQGALKRKLAEMKMQSSQLEHQQEDCERQKSSLVEKRKILLRKMDKYQYLCTAERKQKRLREARIEESETEERISWQR